MSAVLAGVRGELGARLADHLTDVELHAWGRRTERLVARGVLPGPDGGWPAIPWPPF